MSGPGRPMVFGVPDLVTAIEIQLSLEHAGVRAWADVGQQGWPATVWVQHGTGRGTIGRDLVLDVVWTAAPRTRRLRVLDIRRESVRVTVARAASTAP